MAITAAQRLARKNFNKIFNSVTAFDNKDRDNLYAAFGNVADLATQVANLNAWATALATKLNAEAAGGVATFDTNYDTNPQA